MKKLVVLAAIFLFFAVFCLDCAAEDTLPEGYQDISSAIPEDVAELLPDGLLSEELDSVSKAVNDASQPNYLINLAIDLLSGGLGSALSLFASLVVLLSLSALLGSGRNALLSPSASEGVSFATSIALAVSIVGMQSGKFQAVSAYFSSLSSVMTALIPVMSALYLSGGNVSSAALSNTTFVLWLDLINLMVTGILMPAATLCLAIALADSLRGGKSLSLGGISGMIKRTLSFIFGLASILLATALGAQSTLAASADSVGARTVKYIAGNIIPVLGSTVADSLRTVAASTKLLRSTVGVSGIIIIAVMLLPTLISLWLTRFAFTASAAVGEMLGCDREVRLLREVASIYGYLIGAAAMTALLFIFALTVFAVTGSAAGGM